MSEVNDEGIPQGLGKGSRAVKRAFDVVIAGPALLLASPVICLAIAAATVDTREWGIFSQVRIGKRGKPFKVHKIRSMRSSVFISSTVTTSHDPRITRIGRMLRHTKIDELLQLWDVVVGNMSLVGPRPDVAGWADQLRGEDRVILSVRPGITGPASVTFRNEEQLLAESTDPELYNRAVIWPEKIKLNRHYCENWTLSVDIALIGRTIFG